MELKEAILGRRSIRGYQKKPVAKNVLEEVLQVAARASSSVNAQPWEFVVASGEVLKRLGEENVKCLNAGEPLDVDDISLTGIYHTRRVDVAKQLFGAMGIERSDAAGKAHWRERGFRFFDAPAVIFICMDKSLDKTEFRLSIGCIVQNICLAAMEHGLGTCIENQAVMYQRPLHQYLEIPESKFVEIGIAIGYPDKEFPANEVITSREDIGNITTWHGFE